MGRGLAAVWSTRTGMSGVIDAGNGEPGRRPRKLHGTLPRFVRWSRHGLGSWRHWPRPIGLPGGFDERPPELDRRAAFEALLDILGGDAQCDHRATNRAWCECSRPKASARSASPICSGRAVGKGISAARSRRPAVQRGGIFAADRRRPAAGGPRRTRPAKRCCCSTRR